MVSKSVYLLLYCGMWLLGLLPFKVLYLLSDFNYFWVYYVGRYRRKVVRHNLENSFPGKSRSELRDIERRFYRYLCDYMLEDVKLMHMSAEDLQNRMKYLNTELFLEMVKKYGGIILMIPHYANYEWIIGMGAIMGDEGLPVQVYKPLRNPYMDELFKKIRSRFGGYNVPKHSTVRELIRLKRDGKRVVVGLITDQWPSINDAHYWTTFLNQETVFMDGAERIAKMMNFPVFYCDMTKERRGYCTVNFDMITEFPKETAEGEITGTFARRVEQSILHQPAFWLWSHKRWKRTRSEMLQ